jgi:hypothetical protein
VIDFQKAVASQRDRAVIAMKQILVLQIVVDGLKFLPNIDAELLLKVTGIKPSGF